MKKIFKKIVQFYLKIFTKIVLWRHKPFIIAVAGTTNKTTVKEYILKFMREKYGEEEVRGNPKSYNTEIGLPLAILYLDSGESSSLKWLKILAQAKMKALFGRKFPSKLVLELGVDRPGDMKYLLDIAKPSVAIITNIEANYSYPNAGLDKFFEEYKLLIEKIPSGGKVILNVDDERVRNLSAYSKAEVITYGFSEGSDALAKNIQTDAEGQIFEFSFRNEKEPVRIKKYGRHFVYAWLVAKAVKSIL